MYLYNYMYVCIVWCSLFCVIDTIKCKQQQIILFTFYICVDISGKVRIWDMFFVNGIPNVDFYIIKFYMYM